MEESIVVLLVYVLLIVLLLMLNRITALAFIPLKTLMAIPSRRKHLPISCGVAPFCSYGLRYARGNGETVCRPRIR